MKLLPQILLTAVCALAPLAAPAVDSFVVPSEYTAVESPDGGNAAPLGLDGGDTRCQQIYLDLDIPNGPFTIYGVAFRPDAAGVAISKSLASVDIELSTTVLGSTTLNSTFASNIVTTPVLVRSGALELATQATGPVGGPKDFDFEIFFDEPFAYNGGDLLLDVRVNSTEAGFVFFEPISVTGDAIGRTCSAGLFENSGGADSPTSDFTDSGGLVTKFLLVPEPESSASAVAAFAVLASAAARRSRRA